MCAAIVFGVIGVVAIVLYLAEIPEETIIVIVYAVQMFLMILNIVVFIFLRKKLSKLGSRSFKRPIKSINL